MDIRLHPLEPSDWNRAEGIELEAEEEINRINECKPPSFVFEEGVSKEGKYECDLLCIGLCGAGASFVRSAVINSVQVKKIAVMHQEFSSNRLDEEEIHNRVSNKTSTDKGDCTIYALEDPTILVAEASQKITSLQTFNWTQTLIKNISFKRLIILDSILQSQYQVDFEAYPPLLRSITTSKQQLTKSLIPLEAPNVVEGLAASLLSKCEVLSIPATLLLSLEENHILEGDTLRAFESVVLPSLKIRNKGPIDYKTVLAALKGRRVNSLFL
ncbi:proteasome assembly chaperone PAC1 [Acrasis kona]|uniref:Proteasome assembly chaperone 1 n=1 Tax=Acrasis kona TaxID=1008807 RepID=A0AAW2YNR5_9EUKA